jgi:predicted Zn finger-like uncharacterized protein
MLIVCPNCSKSYQIDASSIGARGRSVRCVRCRSVWFAIPPADVPAPREPEPASDEAVSAFRSELGAEAAAPPPIADVLPVTGIPPVADAPPTATPEPTAEPSLGETATTNAAAEAPTADEPAETEPAPVALSDIPIPVTDAPPLAPGYEPGLPHDAARPAIDNGPVDIETVAQRRRRSKARARNAKPKTRMPLVIVAFAILCAALLGWRKDVVRQMPQLASFYASIGLPVNLRGLSFTGVTIGRESHDGVPVLVVEGTIVNGVATPVDVPRLRFALRNAAGAEVYAWTAVPSQAVLEPGAQLPFRSRLASPPDDGHDVQVRFFTRRDVVVGLH